MGPRVHARATVSMRGVLAHSCVPPLTVWGAGLRCPVLSPMRCLHYPMLSPGDPCVARDA